MVTRKQESADRTLLNGMFHTADAGHLSGNRRGCVRGTRRDILLRLECWLNDQEDKRVFWLNGLAGTGKSTIAQTFAQTSFAEGKLGASFFCSRDFSDKSNSQAIFPTLALQLAHHYPPFREELLQVLKARPNVTRETPLSQMEKLIVTPLKITHIPTLIIIDALDECRDEEPTSTILSILSYYMDQIPFVKFFITGRPESHIRSGFRLQSLQPYTEVFKLHDVKRSAVDSDIRLFFRTQLANIAKNRSDCSVLVDWPSSPELDILCTKAAGLFIYASSVIRFIASRGHRPAERLTEITLLPQNTAKEGRFGIDQFYTDALQLVLSNVEADYGEFYSCFRLVVGAVLLVFNPLSVNAFSELLGVSYVSTTLRSLHSLLIIPTSEQDPTPIHILHKSFSDFLMDPERCRDPQFLIDPSIYHREILLSCLRIMKARLKRNICQLDDHILLSEVDDLETLRAIYIGDGLGYACQFWTRHLARTVSSKEDVEEVHEAINRFFLTSLLSWIEVLSLMQKLGAGVHAINDIDKWYQTVSFT